MLADIALTSDSSYRFEEARSQETIKYHQKEQKKQFEAYVIPIPEYPVSEYWNSLV